MICCQCQGIEGLFNKKVALRQMQRYRKKGPTGTTRLLIETLKAKGIQGLTLLDIGGGIGTIPYELLDSGLSKATSVEASKGYIEVSKTEAKQQNVEDDVDYCYGNFVDLAPDLEQFDVVTLNRVICCYHDMPKLVGLSSDRTKQLYALVYPRDTWWVKGAVSFVNFVLRILRKQFQVFVHPTREVEAIIYQHGLKQYFHNQTFIWQVVIYARSSPS